MKHANLKTALIEPKEDLYYAIHKALRLANAKMLIRIGQTDAQDQAGMASMLAALRDHLRLCAGHLHHEDVHIHSALAERCPGASSEADEDHDEHKEAFEELQAIALDLETAKTGRSHLLRRLYQRFALFFADDLVHMHGEENQIMPEIARNFTPEETRDIEHRIVSSIPQAEMISTTRLILEAASPAERRDMVAGMKAAMPADIFEGFMFQVTGGSWKDGDLTTLEVA